VGKSLSGVAVMLALALACAAPTSPDPTPIATIVLDLQATFDAATITARTPAAEPSTRTGAHTPSLAGSVMAPNPTTPASDVAVAQLVIAPIPGGLPSYDRGDWKHWIDRDRDCQDTRAEVLIAGSAVAVGFRNGGQCTVDNGQWSAPYTGVTIGIARVLDVDHMVPLANAHRSGAWAWTDEERKNYANDLSFDGHLIVATASANRSKGARGPEEWKPPDSSYWCNYAVDWIAVKTNWNLTATAGEWTALEDMLETCSFEVVIGASAAPPIPETITHTASATPESPFGSRTGEPLRYDPKGPDRNCGDFGTWAEAQDFYEAAGGPETDRHRLDRGRNGIACESLPGAP